MSSSATSTYDDNASEDHGIMEEHTCMRRLKEFCQTSHIDISNDTIFRFACFYSFNMIKAKAAIEASQDTKYLQLRMHGKLEEQFETGTLFPLPGLQTKKRKSNVFYMRPSRYCPSTKNDDCMLENLMYVLNDMSSSRDKCRKGVALIANMKGWTDKNFSMDYWSKFMQVLQGQMVPTRVDLFLIVNPPSSFINNVWKPIMRPLMLSPSFAKKVHIIKQNKLAEFLKRGYEAYLPDELHPGWRSTPEIVEDYIDQRTYQDAAAGEEKTVERLHTII